MALAQGWELAGPAFALVGFAVGVGSVVAISLRQRLTPDDLMGRVAGAWRGLVWGAAPVGCTGGRNPGLDRWTPPAVGAGRDVAVCRCAVSRPSAPPEPPRGYPPVRVASSRAIPIRSCRSRGTSERARWRPTYAARRAGGDGFRRRTDGKSQIQSMSSQVASEECPGEGRIGLHRNDAISSLEQIQPILEPCSRMAPSPSTGVVSRWGQWT